jgi:hypothetical protein
MEFDSRQLSASCRKAPASLWRNLEQAVAFKLCTATFLVTSAEITLLGAFAATSSGAPAAFGRGIRSGKRSCG